MKRIYVPLLAVMLGAVMLAAGQNPPTSSAPPSSAPPSQTAASAAMPSLTLQQAQALALKNHPQVLASQYNMLASYQVIREQRAAYFPTLTGEIGGSEADRSTRLGVGSPYPNSPLLWSKFAQGLTVNQLITDSGRTPSLVASSKLQAQSSKANLQATKYDVLLAVNEAYFEVLRADALLRVAQKTVDERQVVVDQVSAMVSNKLKSKLDLSFVDVNLAQAKLLELTSEDNLNKAYAQLSRALGTRDNTRYALQAVQLPAAPPMTTEEAVGQAMANRPELLSMRLMRDSAYKFERAQRDLSFPTVSASVVGGFIPDIAQLNLPKIVPNHYDAAMINVDVPIFNGGLFAADREQALLQARASDQNLRNTRQQIVRDVRDSWADATSGYQRIAVTQQLLDEARMALALAQGRYNLGLGSIVELTEGQLRELQAEIENVNAQYDYHIQSAMLRYQEGLLQ